jgi:hypothetical protein
MACVWSIPSSPPGTDNPALSGYFFEIFQTKYSRKKTEVGIETEITTYSTKQEQKTKTIMENMYQVRMVGSQSTMCMRPAYSLFSTRLHQ